MKMKNPLDTEAKGCAQIHNVRFYNIQPRSIQCMQYNKIFNKLAVCRNDGSIEIWDMHFAPCLEKIIPTTPGNSVEGIVWAGERLFSVGLTGELVEWDLKTLKARRKQHMTGNVLWCIDVDRLGTELAIGTEEGYINIMSIDDDQMQYKNLFDRQEGRVLCCKYDATGDYLITGSVGAIRIWNTRTGHALHKMTVAHGNKADVIVWSLQVLKDFSIISGDSSGYVTVWDGNTASQVESYQVLKADVLTIAVNEEESLLMCSGNEPIIRIFAKTQIKREDMIFNRWVKYLQRQMHNHDVKALVFFRDRIFSGGVDGYLCISSATRTSSEVSKYGPFLQNPCVTVAPSAKHIMLRYTNYLEVWRLGTARTNITTNEKTQSKSNQSGARETLSLASVPEKLLVLKSMESIPITCAALSPDSKWICYSTEDEIRIFKFATSAMNKNGKISVKLDRIRDLPVQFSPSSHLHFTTDSQRLLLVNQSTKHIYIFSMVANGGRDLNYVESIPFGKYIKDNVSMFTISQCASYIVMAGADHTIAVWSLFNGKHYKHHLTLPRYTALTTALAIHNKEPRLVVAFADGKIFEYDLEDMCFICATSEHFVENTKSHPISNIVLDERNPNIFILHNDTYLYVLEKYSPQSSVQQLEEADDQSTSPHKQSMKKSKSIESENKVVGLRLKKKWNYEHNIHLSRLSANELIAVGVNPVSLLEQLPDAYKQKKFGVS